MNWKDTIKKAPLADTVDRKRMSQGIQFEKETGSKTTVAYMQSLMGLGQTVDGLDIQVNIGNVLKSIRGNRTQFINNLESVSKGSKALLDFLKANSTEKPTGASTGQGTPIVQKNS